MSQYRMIVRAYDPDGKELFPEREYLGDSYEELARTAAHGLGVFLTGDAPKSGAARRSKSTGHRRPRRRKAATSATGPETDTGGAGE